MKTQAGATNNYDQTIVQEVPSTGSYLLKCDLCGLMHFERKERVDTARCPNCQREDL